MKNEEQQEQEQEQEQQQQQQRYEEEQENSDDLSFLNDYKLSFFGSQKVSTQSNDNQYNYPSQNLNLTQNNHNNNNQQTENQAQFNNYQTQENHFKQMNHYPVENDQVKQEQINFYQPKIENYQKNEQVQNYNENNDYKNNYEKEEEEEEQDENNDIDFFNSLGSINFGDRKTNNDDDDDNNNNGFEYNLKNNFNKQEQNNSPNELFNETQTIENTNTFQEIKLKAVIEKSSEYTSTQTFIPQTENKKSHNLFSSNQFQNNNNNVFKDSIPNQNHSSIFSTESQKISTYEFETEDNNNENENENDNTNENDNGNDNNHAQKNDENENKSQDENIFNKNLKDDEFEEIDLFVPNNDNQNSLYDEQEYTFNTNEREQEENRLGNEFIINNKSNSNDKSDEDNDNENENDSEEEISFFDQINFSSNQQKVNSYGVGNNKSSTTNQITNNNNNNPDEIIKQNKFEESFESIDLNKEEGEEELEYNNEQKERKTQTQTKTETETETEKKLENETKNDDNLFETTGFQSIPITTETQKYPSIPFLTPTKNKSNSNMGFENSIAPPKFFTPKVSKSKQFDNLSEELNIPNFSVNRNEDDQNNFFDKISPNQYKINSMNKQSGNLTTRNISTFQPLSFNSQNIQRSSSLPNFENNNSNDNDNNNDNDNDNDNSNYSKDNNLNLKLNGEKRYSSNFLQGTQTKKSPTNQWRYQPHSFASFGFGGKLLITRPPSFKQQNRKEEFLDFNKAQNRVVKLVNLNQIIKNNKNVKLMDRFPGPLKSFKAQKVLEYLNENYSSLKKNKKKEKGEKKEEQEEEDNFFFEQSNFNSNHGNKNDMKEQINKKEKENTELLTNILSLLIKYKGIFGKKKNSEFGPEKEISDLLNKNHDNNSNNNQNDNNNNDDDDDDDFNFHQLNNNVNHINAILSNNFNNSVDPIQMKNSLIKIEEYLLKGEKKNALIEALKTKLWAQAIIISSQLPNEDYKSAINEFSTFYYQPNSTINFLNKQLSNDFYNFSKTTSTCKDLSQWKQIIAILLMNKTKQTPEFLLDLGTKLIKRFEKTQASHICFLSANLLPGSVNKFKIENMTKNNNKKNNKKKNYQFKFSDLDYVLIGGNHHNKKNKRYFIRPETIQLTQIYEYAKRLSNSQFKLAYFAVYKLFYAYFLAEYGFLKKAQSYCDNLSQFLKSLPKNHELTQNIFFSSLLKELDYRLRINLGIDLNANNNQKFKGFWNVVDKGINLFINGNTVSKNQTNFEYQTINDNNNNNNMNQMNNSNNMNTMNNYSSQNNTISNTTFLNPNSATNNNYNKNNYRNGFNNNGGYNLLNSNNNTPKFYQTGNNNNNTTTNSRDQFQNIELTPQKIKQTNKSNNNDNYFTPIKTYDTNSNKFHNVQITSPNESKENQFQEVKLFTMQDQSNQLNSNYQLNYPSESNNTLYNNSNNTLNNTSNNNSPMLYNQSLERKKNNQFNSNSQRQVSKKKEENKNRFKQENKQHKNIKKKGNSKGNGKGKGKGKGKEKEKEKKVKNENKGGEEQGIIGSIWNKTIGGLFTSNKPKKKVVKGNLGLKNDFYYDKDAGRWLRRSESNEKKKKKKKIAPPPLKFNNNLSNMNTNTNTNMNMNNQSNIPQKKNGPPKKNNLPIKNSGPKPSFNVNNYSIGRDPRSRYVDVFATTSSTSSTNNSTPLTPPKTQIMKPFTPLNTFIPNNSQSSQNVSVFKPLGNNNNSNNNNLNVFMPQSFNQTNQNSDQNDNNEESIPLNN
ncbi:secretory 16 [Anaeramoeba flamelloides]|uniref:Protein transport protein sec16 n=1 Tax=Anaeramoeba flamelloides TaxID=1746091 RepID=A0ABQ8Z4X4_9EUKA|nr:secretory 16 [Anaeramoeba flamelloides]